MSSAHETVDIDKCLVYRFGATDVPEISHITIKNVSEIPDRVQELKALKYGPKIAFDINDIKDVTVQYQAGFTGKNGKRFCESLMIQYGSQAMSHESIRRMLRNELDRSQVSSSFSHNIKEVMEKVNKVGSVIYALEKTAEEYVHGVATAVDGKDCKIDAISRVADTAFRTTKTTTCSAGEVLDDQLACLFEAHHSLASNFILQSRILTIWFLAESFRYPPMLFYSLLLLHLYSNKFISRKELEEKFFHPSEEPGSQNAQYFCYLRETESLRNDVNLRNDEKFGSRGGSNQDLMKDDHEIKAVVKKIEARKLGILKLLRDNIYKTCRERYSPDNSLRYANMLFRGYVQMYLRMCAGEEAMATIQPNYDKLVESLGRVQ